MLYGDFIDDLKNRLKSDDTKEVRTILGRKINQSYREIANSFDWPYLKRQSEIVSIANVTGMARTTQGSRTVDNGSGFTSAMEGRYFKPSNSDNWYKIIRRVSATELTLHTPIAEAGQTGDYVIWKRFYYLHSDVRNILLFGSWTRGGELESRSERWMHDHSANVSDVSTPDNYILYGADPFESSYVTGGVTTVLDSDLLTGVSLNGNTPSWLGNAEPGDIIEVESNTYRVKRVESDVRIRMFNGAKVDVSTATAYTIRKDNPIGIQFFYSPDGASYVFSYSYQKRVFDMVNEDTDRPEVPDDFDVAILDMAEASRMSDIKDDQAGVKFGVAMARIRDLKVTFGFMDQPRTRQLIPRIPTRKGY